MWTVITNIANSLLTSIDLTLDDGFSTVDRLIQLIARLRPGAAHSIKFATG